MINMISTSDVSLVNDGFNRIFDKYSVSSVLGELSRLVSYKCRY